MLQQSRQCTKLLRILPKPRLLQFSMKEAEPLKQETVSIGASIANLSEKAGAQPSTRNRKKNFSSEEDSVHSTQERDGLRQTPKIVGTKNLLKPVLLAENSASADSLEPSKESLTSPGSYRSFFSRKQKCRRPFKIFEHTASTVEEATEQTVRETV